MILALKNCALRYNGTEYQKGTLLELPEEMAKKLASENPHDFDLVSDPAGKAAAPAAAVEVPDFNAMTVDALKAYASKHQIDLAGARKRGDILNALQAGKAAGAPLEEAVALPDVDLAQTVK
ncbi:hypothetical protein [uncultured Acidaminococcus sp.]|uniref:hypothetical protein n=1 Tax=uncultured Acidaminococcus sp. TaxID=352152 RepID=UPI0026DD3C6D|nr:hypothetical protein [uncultured Acidaminococcus sp.]